MLNLRTGRGAGQQVTTRPCHQRQCGNHTDPRAAQNPDPARGGEGTLAWTPVQSPEMGATVRAEGTLPSQETALWAQRRPRVWCVQPSRGTVDTEQVLHRGLAG